jgi:hypothetical protein
LDKDNPSAELLMELCKLSLIHPKPLKLANALGRSYPLKDVKIDKKKSGVGLKLS